MHIPRHFTDGNLPSYHSIGNASHERKGVSQITGNRTICSTVCSANQKRKGLCLYNDILFNCKINKTRGIFLRKVHSRTPLEESHRKTRRAVYLITWHNKIGTLWLLILSGKADYVLRGYPYIPCTSCWEKHFRINLQSRLWSTLLILSMIFTFAHEIKQNDIIYTILPLGDYLGK